ncbi:hypothetical protein [Streptomyces sp. G45]|uniref:hypothetical protein n=1 Tax=Streptomyces sp. G45 TaxID=3406627 RepID=UPI003C1C651F
MSSVGGSGVLSAVLWAGLLVMVGCLLVALLAECCEPPLGSALVMPMSRSAKLRRTGAVFFVIGSAFALCYALAGWKLLAGPSSACSTGADWGSERPRTWEYSLLPPQATCQYTSGHTQRLNPDWLASLTVELAIPALLAGIGFVLAWHRWRQERRAARPDDVPDGAPGDVAGDGPGDAGHPTAKQAGSGRTSPPDPG